MCKQVGPAKVWNSESKSENKASRSPTASPKKSVSELLAENKCKASRSPTAPSKKSIPELVGENKGRNRSRSRSSTPSKKQAEAEEQAAFRGAKFDKAGFCINHSKVQLANPIRGDDGKVVYQELKTFCRSCQSAKHKSKRGTSLSGGTVREAPRRPNLSPGKSSTRSRSRSIERKKKPVFSTPFDEKGRCHYHKNVQLAGKKMTGGWKVIYPICPKCMEDKLEEDGDDRSVKSSKSSRSSRSSLSLGSRGNAHGQYDKNGCCVIHKHVQVAKKKVFGNGFKVLRVCPACTGGEKISMDDAVSVSSHSVSSRRSSRSAVSTSSRGKKVTSSRYGALPFDGEGYCCQHPSVQMAHKKMMGGFKILMDVCPECAADGGINPKKSPRRKSQGTGRIYDDSGSECSSVISGISGASSVSMKKIRVTNMKLTDEDGKVGKYSGYVNDEYKPHGNGAIKYNDGSAWKGVWNEGSQVHGKSTNRRSRSKSRN